MEDGFVDAVVSLYNEKKWTDIVKLNADSKAEVARRLLWVWPSIDNLKFIKNKIKENNLSGIISIGCGRGLLEWLFQQYSKLDVIGYEINQEWWSSKYSAPLFIELKYSTMSALESILDPNFALLFCYFNNGPAFIEYVDSYSGSLLFIIGPGEGRGTYTNPEPFEPKFGRTKWRLLDYQEVKTTKDFIAVYTRENVI